MSHIRRTLRKIDKIKRMINKNLKMLDELEEMLVDIQQNDAQQNEKSSDQPSPPQEE